MHVRRKSRTDRAKGQPKDLGATAQARAVETASTLSEKAQTTIVPAAEQTARVVSERYQEDVLPALQNAASTASAVVAAAAEAAREEAEKRTRKSRKELKKSAKKARKRAKKRGADAADRARSTVGREQPKSHKLRNLFVALGLAGAAAYVANKMQSGDGGTVIPTTPPPTAPPADPYEPVANAKD